MISERACLCGRTGGSSVCESRRCTSAIIAALLNYHRLVHSALELS